MFDILSSLFGRSGDGYARLGLKYFQAGDFVHAIEMLEKALRQKLGKYKRDEIATILGNAWQELDQPEKAIAAHLQALDLNSRNHQAWVNLGVANRMADRLEDARKCYAKALTLKPDYTEAHLSLGVLNTITNRPEEAVASLERACQLDPDNGTCFGNLALALAMTGVHHQAATRLNQAITLGYEGWRVVKQRIDALEEADDEFDPLDWGKFELHCSKCGSVNRSHPREDALDRPIPCPDCGGPTKKNLGSQFFSAKGRRTR